MTTKVLVAGPLKKYRFFAASLRSYFKHNAIYRAVVPLMPSKAFHDFMSDTPKVSLALIRDGPKTKFSGYPDTQPAHDLGRIPDIRLKKVWSIFPRIS